MKESFYNHVIYSGGWGYWYNALTNSYFRLSEELSRKVQDCFSSNEKIGLLESTPIFAKLVDNGFIVKDDIDELSIIRERHKKAVDDKNYFLIILPTLNCNYKCWYCIQDHVPSIMDASTLRSICNHIDYMISQEHITSLHLDWFGGEPFMFFDKIIKPITKYAIKRCKEQNIPFMCGATTNGYFINGKISRQLTDLQFRQFQITLDGEKQYHDKVKFTKGCESTFDHVLGNINGILEYNDSVRIFLRINYTHDSLTENIVEQVNSFIDIRYRERVIITPKKVWQEAVDKKFSSILIPILDSFEQSGYMVARMDMLTSSIPCYVNRKYYNAISYNGHVVKCTACDDLYSTEPKGRLMPDGIIKWTDSYDELCTAPTFENERCLECNKLPLCMGQCPRDHLLGYRRCKYDVFDEDLETTLLDFLNNVYKSE